MEDPLISQLEWLIADWRVPHRYTEVIARTLCSAAKDLERIVHPELYEYENDVTPPLPPVPGVP